MKNVIKAIRYLVYLMIIGYAVFILTILILPLIKLNPLSITNDDMKPKFPNGSLIITRDVDASYISGNDVITYVTDEEPYRYDTGRVVGKDIENRGFIVKGDDVNKEDEKQVKYVSVVGKVLYSIPLLGYLNIFISYPIGKILSVIGVFGLLLIPYLLEFFKE